MKKVKAKKQADESAGDRAVDRLAEIKAMTEPIDSAFRQFGRDLSSNLGKGIAKQRAKRGWSLDELAERSGVDRSNIWKLETGRYQTANVSTLIKLADAFKCGYSSFFSTSTELDSITYRRLESVIERIARLPDKDKRAFLDFIVQVLDGRFSKATRKKK